MGFYNCLKVLCSVFVHTKNVRDIKKEEMDKLLKQNCVQLNRVLRLDVVTNHLNT